MTVPEPAPGIPSYWESDVVLVDGGTVHLRPRRDGDHDAIVDLYSRMSDHSRYLRFAGPTSSDRAGDLESRATVDLDHHFAVVAELGEQIVGVAGYFREGADRAEGGLAGAASPQGPGPPPNLPQEPGGGGRGAGNPPVRAGGACGQPKKAQGVR